MSILIRGRSRISVKREFRYKREVQFANFTSFYLNEIIWSERWGGGGSSRKLPAAPSRSPLLFDTDSVLKEIFEKTNIEILKQEDHDDPGLLT